MTLYGVRMPVFRAGDMVACRSISERCFVERVHGPVDELHQRAVLPRQ